MHTRRGMDLETPPWLQRAPVADEQVTVLTCRAQDPTIGGETPVHDLAATHVKRTDFLQVENLTLRRCFHRQRE